MWVISQLKVVWEQFIRIPFYDVGEFTIDTFVKY